MLMQIVVQPDPKIQYNYCRLTRLGIHEIV
jgi:hypothetical protein